MVHYLNYGSFLGQVRVNAFVGNQPKKWQLREFRVLPVAAQTLAFLPAPVSSNPLAEFYANGAGASLLQTERVAYQGAFGSTYMGQLRNTDETALASTSDADFKEKLFNTMGAAINPRHNEFQSDAQGSADIPAMLAGTTIKAQIPATWNAPMGTRSISQSQMLNRAGAITCGGCHQFSPGQSIGTLNGQPVAWPASAGFVHISEQTNADGHILSPALHDFFIPFRRKVTRTVYNRPLLIQYKQPLDLIPGNAKIRTLPPGLLQSLVRRRTDAEALARTVLARAPVPAARPQLEKAAPLVRPQALQLRRVSEEAHAREFEQPGFFVEFRRPH